MGLQELWFGIIAVLFLGFFILEGFDFGVGMLMEPFAPRAARATRKPHRRAALNTIGPVWDGNEVWLITAGAAMFAAFPGWYATVFSTLYLPLLAILFGMIVRVVSIEWRGKIDDPKWRAWADFGIAAGSWLPGVLWGVAFAVLVRGLPVDADEQVHLSISDVLNAYTLLGGLATAGLFLFYGAVFVALKTAGAIRDDALPIRRVAVASGDGTGCGLWALDATGAWQGLDLGWCWRSRWSRSWRRWCWCGARIRTAGRSRAPRSVVAAVVVLLFGALYPNLVPSTLNPQWSLTIYNASSTPVHPQDHDLGDGDLRPADGGLPGVDVLGFPATDLGRTDTRRHRPGEACVLSARIGNPGTAGPATVAGIGRVAPLPGRRGGLRRGDLRLRDRLGDCAGEHRRRASSPMPRRAACAPGWARCQSCWRCGLSARVAHWLQARLGQRGASAVIADLSGQVLAAVTARQPRELAAQRDAAAVVVTRGLDGLRPYFTGYLPTLLLAAILTPATVAVIAVYDLKSAAIVVITLPLIPVFMVLIGLATADRSAAALAAMTTLQARLLDLIAGIPTLRALGRAGGPEHRIAELGAAHRRSAMATLRIAFLSALVLELLATLGVALVAVGIGLRLVFGEMTLTTGLTVLLLAPDVYWPLRRIGVEFHAAQDGRTAADKAFALIGEPAARGRGTETVAARGRRRSASKTSAWRAETAARPTISPP